MSHLIEIYAVCKLSYFRLWNLELKMQIQLFSSLELKELKPRTASSITTRIHNNQKIQILSE